MLMGDQKSQSREEPHRLQQGHLGESQGDASGLIPDPDSPIGHLVMRREVQLSEPGYVLLEELPLEQREDDAEETELRVCASALWKQEHAGGQGEA